MNSKIIIFIIAMIAGATLMLGGAYLTIDNYLHPQGLMFEGIVLGALGTLLTLMVSIALSIGETVMIFGQIMEQQVKIQQEMREMAKMANSSPRPGNINSILSNLLPGMTDENTSISITDLSSGEIPKPEDFPIDLEHVRRMMSKGRGLKSTDKNSELGDMGLERLEKELAKAIKKDDYERAGKINQAIKILKNGPEPDETEDPEEKE